MSAWPEPASFQEARPKTMKFCKTCHKETPHELHEGAGVRATICIPCLRRALCYEMDRD